MTDFANPPPAAPLSLPVSPAASWIGAGALGLTFGGQQIARVPGADGGVRYTVIPLPVSPAMEITMQHRADAVSATYTGWLQNAVDLYRLSVERNGFMVGVLATMAHGFLGFPLAWQGGSPEMISALADQDGTPGDYSRMHPENECAKIFSDGIGLGFGLGQYLLMCWQCDGVEWNKVAGATDAHVAVEVCRTCGARRIDRPAGARELFQLRWRDARWLWRNPVTLQWYYTGRQAMVAVNPGDGEWFLFRTVPDQDIWAHGPWALGTESAILARDAMYDEANTAAVCAPTHVFQFSGASDPKTRKDVDAQSDNLRFANKLTLPGQVSHDIHAAKAEFVDVCSKIENRASDAWEVALTGNKMGQQSGTGFSNMDVYQRVTTKRRVFYSTSWNRQIRAQGLIWYTLGNFGTRNAPIGVSDVESPEEKLARSKADEQEGVALKSLREGLDAVGYELEPAYLEERMQRKGIRVRQQAGRGPRVLAWDARTLAGSVTMEQAIADQGLPPLQPGDPRASMFVAAALHPGGDATPAGATESPPAQTSQAGGPLPSPPAASPAPAARVVDDCDPEIDGDCDAEEDARRASLAAGLSDGVAPDGSRVVGWDRCEHGRTHACPRCGVTRVYGAPKRAADGSAVHPIAWRAVPTKRGAAAPAGMAPSSPAAAP